MPRTVNNLFTTHGKDVLSSGAERVNYALSPLRTPLPTRILVTAAHEARRVLRLCGDMLSC